MRAEFSDLVGEKFARGSDPEIPEPDRPESRSSQSLDRVTEGIE